MWSSAGNGIPEHSDWRDSCAAPPSRSIRRLRPNRARRACRSRTNTSPPPPSRRDTSNRVCRDRRTASARSRQAASSAACIAFGAEIGAASTRQLASIAAATSTPTGARRCTNPRMALTECPDWQPIRGGRRRTEAAARTTEVRRISTVFRSLSFRPAPPRRRLPAREPASPAAEARCPVRPHNRRRAACLRPDTSRPRDG